MKILLKNHIFCTIDVSTFEENYVENACKIKYEYFMVQPVLFQSPNNTTNNSNYCGKCT